jgi:uncharacterized membrane protein
MFNFGKKKERTMSSHRWTFGTMLVFGVIGLLVSFILAVDEIELMKNPHAILSCSINVILNCSTVMQTWQASVFGFPNMLIGLMAYPVVITIAVVTLTGAKLPRWFWVIANICYGLGAVFAYWLFFNSVYVIQVLCPWCLVITFTTTILLATITHYSLRNNLFGLSKNHNQEVRNFIDKDYDKLLTASWIVLLIMLVFIKFGNGLFV